jgi:Protein of unknown function (DUF3892)
MDENNFKEFDYAITAIRRDADEKRIIYLEVRLTAVLKLNPPEKEGWTREEVVDAIENKGKSFVTARRADENDRSRDTYNRAWIKGQLVEVIPVGNEKFLKTVANSVAEDNLGELPLF